MKIAIKSTVEYSVDVRDDFRVSIILNVYKTHAEYAVVTQQNDDGNEDAEWFTRDSFDNFADAQAMVFSIMEANDAPRPLRNHYWMRS